MTTTADIIRQYAATCALQDTQLDRPLTVDDLQWIAEAVEHDGNMEIDATDALDMRERLYLCRQGKAHWQYGCGEDCR